jgi:5'-3' exonuclease
MGIENFYKFLKNKNIVGVEIDNNYGKKFEGTNVLVDTSIYINKFVQVHRGKYLSDIVDKNGTIITHIPAFLFFTIQLMKKGQRPVFIFDGTRDFHLKKMVSEKRKKGKEDASKKLANLLPTDKGFKTAFQQSFSVQDSMLKLLKDVFDLAGIDYIVASGEADPLCAALIMKGYASTIYTEDSDILVYGAESTIRNNGKMVEYKRSDILTALNISNEEFISICIAAGCDYCSNIDKVGLITLYKLIIDMRKVEPINNVRQILEHYKNNSNKVISTELEKNMIDAFDFFMTVNNDSTQDKIIEECDLSHTIIMNKDAVRTIDKDGLTNLLTDINSYQNFHTNTTIQNTVRDIIAVQQNVAPQIVVHNKINGINNIDDNSNKMKELEDMFQ